MTLDEMTNFFGSMSTIYGRLWTHHADEMETWRRAMAYNRVEAADLSRAANGCLTAYPSRPPTMGQVIGLVKSSRPTPSTYLPSNRATPTKALLQRIMLGVVLEREGVTKSGLEALRQLNNALTEEYNDRQITEEEAIDFRRQMNNLAEGHERRTT